MELLSKMKFKINARFIPILVLVLLTLSACYKIPTPSSSRPSGPESYSSMALSPSGDRLVVGSDQGVHVYQMEPFTELWFVPFESGVMAVDFSPTDDWMVAKLGGSERFPEPKYESRSVILLNAMTGSKVRVWEAEEYYQGSGITKLEFSPDGTELILGRYSDVIEIQNVFTGDSRKLVEYSSAGIPKENSVGGVAWTPDGKYIAFDTTCVDYSVVLVDAKNGKLLISMDQIPEKAIGVGVHTLVFNSDGTLLAGDLQFKVAIWNSTSGREVESFTLPNGTIRGPFALTVAFSPDDTWLASGWDNGAIVIWNVETGEMVKTLQESGEAVNTVLFYGNDRIITQSASEIKVWDLATGKGTTYLGGSVPAP